MSLRITKIINDELIDIREFAKPNACFQTNEYPDSYDFCILHEQFNPYDLINDNKTKDKEIARLKKEHKKTIDMAIHFINLHQDSKTLSLDYSDLKKLRGLLNNDKFYIKLFKDELKGLKEEGKK